MQSARISAKTESGIVIGAERKIGFNAGRITSGRSGTRILLASLESARKQTTWRTTSMGKVWPEVKERSNVRAKMCFGY
jgi:hypothetical protein